MAIIEFPRPSILDAIDSAHVEEHKSNQYDSVGIGMSELGTECARALWYSHRWAAKEELSAKTLRIFEDGNTTEDQLIAALRRIPNASVSGQQVRVQTLGGHVRGKIDGEMTGVPESPHRTHVVEIKSHNSKSFTALQKKGVRESKPAHWWQCQFYMHTTGYDRALYLAKNKDNGELYSERIKYDPLDVMSKVAKIADVINSKRAPARNEGYYCAWCKFKSVCFREEFGRKHCRSCINSTPVIDPDSSDPKWICERQDNKVLTIDEQRAGCNLHLFHPDMVPGEQVDAGDDWIAYVLVSGDKWTNKEAA